MKDSEDSLTNENDCFFYILAMNKKSDYDKVLGEYGILKIDNESILHSVKEVVTLTLECTE